MKHIKNKGSGTRGFKRGGLMLSQYKLIWTFFGPRNIKNLHGKRATRSGYISNVKV